MRGKRHRTGSRKEDGVSKEGFKSHTTYMIHNVPIHMCRTQYGIRYSRVVASLGERDNFFFRRGQLLQPLQEIGPLRLSGASEGVRLQLREVFKAHAWGSFRFESQCLQMDAEEERRLGWKIPSRYRIHNKLLKVKQGWHAMHPSTLSRISDRLGSAWKDFQRTGTRRVRHAFALLHTNLLVDG